MRSEKETNWSIGIWINVNIYDLFLNSVPESISLICFQTLFQLPNQPQNCILHQCRYWPPCIRGRDLLSMLAVFSVVISISGSVKYSDATHRPFSGPEREKERERDVNINQAERWSLQRGKKWGCFRGAALKIYTVWLQKKDYYHKIKKKEEAKGDKISQIVGRGREDACVETKQFGGGCREIKSNNTGDRDRLWFGGWGELRFGRTGAGAEYRQDH